MLLHPPPDRLDAADDHRVLEPVAAAAPEVRLAEPLAHPAGPVVGQAGVDLQVPVRPPAPLVDVIGKHDGLLDRQHRPLAEHLPGPRRVLRRHEVRVGALRAVAGQLEHLRAERREQSGRCRLPTRDGVRRGVHRVEVAGHRGQRPVVPVTAHPFDQRRVADAEPEDEPPGECRLQGARGGVRRHGVAAVDARDAGGDDKPLAGRQVELRGGERLPAIRLTEPQGAPALGIERRDSVPDCSDVEGVQGSRPDPDPTEHHPRPRESCLSAVSTVSAPATTSESSGSCSGRWICTT